MRLAYLRHIGPCGQPGIPHTWAQFRAWCERQGLRQPGRLMLGMGQDKRHVTPPEELRDIN